MKKLKSILGDIGVIIVAVLVVAVGIYVASLMPKIQSGNLGAANADGNMIQGQVHYSTTTQSYCLSCPVKLVDRNANRQYVLIQNASDSYVWLYFSKALLDYNFTEMTSGYTSATGTITSLNGLVALAPTSTYEIMPDNLMIGQVWATSSNPAAARRINILYQ